MSLPSGLGSRTGQKNSVPCRLIARYSVLVTNSPVSSGTRLAVTMYSSRSSFSSMIGKFSRYSGPSMDPHEILRAGLAHRDRGQELLDPDRLGE